MCGIAGVVTWDERYRVTRATLEAMSARIAHRGPDGAGYLLTREHEPITPDTPQVGFAFRRLAILDPDPRSMQPFTIGHQTLVFNGEIYNFRELRAELTRLRPDYEWRTTGDTEVLLMSHAVWGERCVEHLNGMFALAVWDERERTLFLARDRMGQKPLYFAWIDGMQCFASELGALRPLKLGRDDSGTSGLTSYLRYGTWCDPSLSSDLMAIEPGEHQLTRPQNLFEPVASGRRRISATFSFGSYFDPNKRSVHELPSPRSAREVLRRAVERQLVSDVPLGVFLSGGIDSSVIAACARRCGPVDTFSIGFDDPRYDESGYARRVAQHLGTNHHEFRVTPDAVHDLPKLAEVFGEPFADSSALPTHYLSRETRRHVKVALSGDGGDELFGGYDRYRAMQLGARVRVRGARSVVATVARPWASGHPKSRVTRAARFLSSLSLDDARRYDSYMRIFDDVTISALMNQDPGYFPGVSDVFARQLERTGDPVTAALATDRITYLPNDLLTKVDRCSMLHGLEVRSPFMDHELVQFAAGLTTDQLLKGGPKRMLREAFAKELPDFVFKRKKVGFAVPIGEWFRTDPALKAMLHDNLFSSDSFGADHFNTSILRRLVDEHMSERIDHSQRLYALLMLELWWRTQKR